MNLSEALFALREKDHLIGIYSELVTHLESIQRDGGRIPIYNSTEKFVDDGYIDEVRDILENQVSSLIEDRKQILEWEVICEDDTDSG